MNETVAVNQSRPLAERKRWRLKKSRSIKKEYLKGDIRIN